MELIATAVQEVGINQNILFTDTAVSGNCSIYHREGSGLVTIKGQTNTQCRARYKVSFGANIAIPTGGTVEAITVAIALDGEPLASTFMILTPAAVETYNHVYGSVFLDIPRGCCSTVSVKNINPQEINVQNANLIIERVA